MLILGKGITLKNKGMRLFYVTDIIHLSVEAFKTRVTADEESHNIMSGSLFLTKSNRCG